MIKKSNHVFLFIWIVIKRETLTPVQCPSNFNKSIFLVKNKENFEIQNLRWEIQGLAHVILRYSCMNLFLTLLLKATAVCQSTNFEFLSVTGDKI